MTKLSLAENKEGKIVFQGNGKRPRRKKEVVRVSEAAREVGGSGCRWGQRDWGQ